MQIRPLHVKLTINLMVIVHHDLMVYIMHMVKNMVKKQDLIYV